ncbi:hypothetical protein FOMPIDRAFT_1122418, partial [Fomitopsis schrenkii]
LCCYDYCLTLGREVELVWSGKLSLASVLFYALRYSALLDTVLVMLGYLSWPAWQTTRVRLFTALRVYALFHKSIRLFGVTLALGFITPIILTYSFIRSTPYLLQVTPFYSVCYIETAGADRTSTGMMGARGASIVFDGFVLGLTWRATRRVTALGGSHRVLLRDSTVCPQFLVVVNTWTAMSARLLSPLRPASLTPNLLPPHSLTSVLLSRLMLDLRAALTGLLPTPSTSSASQSLSWTTSSLARTLATLIFSGHEHREEVAIELVSMGTSAASEQDTVAGQRAEEEDCWVPPVGTEDDIVMELREIRPRS